MDLIEHRVRERAYFIWEGEGRVHGRADAHWLRAEAEIAAPAPAEILTVQPVAPEASLAPSPAKVLKPKAPRAGKTAVKPATEIAAKTGIKTAAKPAAKPVTRSAAKPAPKAPKAAARASAPAVALH